MGKKKRRAVERLAGVATGSDEAQETKRAAKMAAATVERHFYGDFGLEAELLDAGILDPESKVRSTHSATRHVTTVNCGESLSVDTRIYSIHQLQIAECWWQLTGQLTANTRPRPSPSCFERQNVGICGQLAS